MAKGLEIGGSFSHYRIVSKIGEGGMGEVYLALDSHLGRQAALKVLHSDLARDEDRVRRFVQEAKAASALNHPNILTVYEIGTVDGLRFIATELIKGETLRQHLRGERFTIRDVLDTALQISSALNAAHNAGIVHRDIKPENIMRRDDGIVKILDFGLAKLIAPPMAVVDPEASTLAQINTQPGAIMGTVVYMSPEQARGKETDARSDIWSLGVVIYEMLAGVMPFAGETMSDSIAAILKQEPDPLDPATPPELQRIVRKSLEKNADERYQTAKDLLLDIKNLRREIEFSAELERSHKPHPAGSSNRRIVQPGEPVPHSTAARTSMIRRHKKGVAAVAGTLVLGIAVAGFLLFPRPAPALGEKDMLLLADFANTTGEGVFDGTLKQALAVQLGQSPFLNIFSDKRVDETLKLMGRTPGEPITRDVAKEICTRQGIKAMIAGSINAMGSHYVITLEAVNGQTGEAIVREQFEAENKEQILKQLGETASDLRGKLGESIGSIKKFDVAIEQATTPSLDALKAFSQASELWVGGHLDESVQFYKRAIELDPNFAIAYARLAVFYDQSGQIELCQQFAQKAYDLRDRVSEREHFYISEKYHLYITGDRDEMISILKAWAESYPNDYVPHNNLGVNYAMFGRLQDFFKENQEAVRLAPDNVNVQSGSVDALTRLSRFDEAKQVLDQTIGQDPDRNLYHSLSYYIAFARGDQETIKRDLDWLRKDSMDAEFFSDQSNAAAFYGHWHEAIDLSHRSTQLHLDDDEKEPGAANYADFAFQDAVVGRCRQAKDGAARSLAVSHGRANLSIAASALAYCNEPAKAQFLIDEAIKRFPKDTINVRIYAPLVRALMEMDRGGYSRAIDLMEPLRRYEMGEVVGFQINYLRAQAYLGQHLGNEAAAEFQKILDNRGVGISSPLYPLAHLGLARAATIVGDRARSQTEYQDFLALWKDADPDLPILIEARKEYERSN
jgi:serine/threonine protein kinase/Flp pilus assembly protein TadD